MRRSRVIRSAPRPAPITAAIRTRDSARDGQLGHHLRRNCRSAAGSLVLALPGGDRATFRPVQSRGHLSAALAFPAPPPAISLAACAATSPLHFDNRPAG